jgi:hypothetical protein
MVVHTRWLSGQGLQRLLADVTDLEVIGHDPKDQADLLRAFRRVRPDVVLLTKGLEDLDDVENVIGLLVSTGRSLNYRVIVLREKDNLVSIYDKRQLTISDLAELYDLVLHDPGG